AEDVEQKALVVAFVAVRQEVGLGLPAVSERRTPIARPIPVSSTVECVRQAADLGLVVGILVEIAGAGEHAREQKRRVEGRQLALPNPPAGVDVEEVVEEALVAGGTRL